MEEEEAAKREEEMEKGKDECEVSCSMHKMGVQPAFLYENLVPDLRSELDIGHLVVRFYKNKRTAVVKLGLHAAYNLRDLRLVVGE
jgi:hypothetical protein